MSRLTERRVVVASLFLPYTVDFELKDARSNMTSSDLESGLQNMSSVMATLPKEVVNSAASTSEPVAGTGIFDYARPARLVQPTRKTLSGSTKPPLGRAASLNFSDALWTVKPCLAGNIGLQNAVSSVIGRLKDLVWVGTLNMSTESLAPKTKEAISRKLIADHACYPVMPTDAEFDGHYNTYCKQVLWPHFHYVMLDDSQSIIYQSEPWQAYKMVNQQFADTIVENYREGDIIWVNDYHLMLLPGMLRERLPNAVIGFFLHIPFPSSELFRTLPQRKEILEGMLQSDLIGFQTYSFARHFLHTCSRILSLEATPSGIQMDSHYIAVRIYPIGIDIQALNRKRADPGVAHWIDLLKEKYAGKKLIVARDRLDYSKGVRQKLLAFEQFLIDHPEWQGKVVLIQITLSTSEQNELRVHISDVVSRVNSTYSNFSYQPIVFLHQDIAFHQYLGLLSSADASLITPLRDGMNLTSHEYIVCQEDRYNPLILSEFTGTYGSFGACLKVNPWDYKQVGNAIHEALTMGEEEKKTRWQELYRSTETHSAQHFAATIITELSNVHDTGARRVSSFIPALDAASLKKSFLSCKKRVFLFDYGGTLIPHGQTSGSADIERAVNILSKLTRDPQNAVYVLSGRTKSTVERDLGNVPNLGLSAENGFYIKPHGEQWQALFENVDLSWKPAVKEIFQYYTERTPGAHVEIKDTSIVWHYRTASGPDAQFVAWQAAECQNHIADSVNKNFAVHVLAGNTNIEVIPHDISKSAIANRILQDIKPDFVLSLGDDRTDEDLFAYLNKQSISQVVTCTVGLRSTEAKYYIPTVEHVLAVLEALTT